MKRRCCGGRPPPRRPAGIRWPPPSSRRPAAARSACSTPIDASALPGAGVQARVSSRAARSHSVLVGNRRLLAEHGIEPDAAVDELLGRLDARGETALIVAVDGAVAGVIGVHDPIRPEAHDVIHDLRHLKIREIAVLTGDREPAARAVAKKVHADTVAAELLPADKARWIEERRAAGRKVAMVGDGINDAPALAQADAGIALGGVGADLAAEAGSLILLGDPLRVLPGLVELARSTVRDHPPEHHRLRFRLQRRGDARGDARHPAADPGGDPPPGRLAARPAQLDAAPGARRLVRAPSGAGDPAAWRPGSPAPTTGSTSPVWRAGPGVVAASRSSPPGSHLAGRLRDERMVRDRAGRRRRPAAVRPLRGLARAGPASRAGRTRSSRSRSSRPTACAACRSGFAHPPGPRATAGGRPRTAGPAAIRSRTRGSC